MPTRALKQCSQPGCRELTNGGRCNAHRRQDRKPFEIIGRERGTTTERGYGASWRKIRDQVLAEEPCCRICAAKGMTTASEEVDHVMPKSKGGTDARANLQGVCNECHKLKTAREDSSVRGRYAALIPDWLKPSVIPLTIVCGPPAAGKSTLIREHASLRDIVIDLDEIIEQLSGRGRYEDRSCWVGRALRYRNELLGALSRPSRYDAAWFVTGAPRELERSRWSQLLLPKQVIVVDTPTHECIARIRADGSRANVAADQIEAVVKWWSAYSSLPGRAGEISKGDRQ